MRPADRWTRRFTLHLLHTQTTITRLGWFHYLKKKKVPTWTPQSAVSSYYEWVPRTTWGGAIFGFLEVVVFPGILNLHETDLSSVLRQQPNPFYTHSTYRNVFCPFTIIIWSQKQYNFTNGQNKDVTASEENFLPSIRSWSLNQATVHGKYSVIMWYSHIFFF